MKKVLAVLAVAGLASSAMAQSFEGRVAFRDNHSLNATPTHMSGDVIEITATGTYEFNVLFGAFNADGFDNRGLFNFVASMNLNDSIAGGSSMAPRNEGPLFGPYNFGNVFTAPNSTSITFDANRGSGEVQNVPWNFGEAPPAESYTYPPFGPGPVSGAPDTYHPGFRFTITISDLTERTVTLDVSGSMQAVDGWFVSGQTPPEEGFPGSQTLLPGGFVMTNASGQLILSIVPAPGAAALLGLGGLVAARRRRA